MAHRSQNFYRSRQANQSWKLQIGSYCVSRKTDLFFNNSFGQLKYNEVQGLAVKLSLNGLICLHVSSL